MLTSVPHDPTFFWFLPTHGDGRYLGTADGGRGVDINYLKQVAVAADSLGYYGVLIPTGKSCEDSWMVAAAMVPLTRRLRYLVAVRPGLQPPSLAARMTATLDRLSEGRALVNVVTGGDPVENRGDGIFLPHGERYTLRHRRPISASARRQRCLFKQRLRARSTLRLDSVIVERALTREFLTVYKRLLLGERVDFEGAHIRVEGAELLYPPVQPGGPPRDSKTRCCWPPLSHRL